ncbi:hypothetical protein EVG20_g7563 [Dentipellis fragilis]|uniref:DNA 3'-5' helicase n=1 Tax=Dentipellis fragilis TaxID=205917 RepID=A0A4Y9YDU1_9AGAM|nr:hypothetical protein EVG20_g7563 [Dentipellis fragilis]
MRRSDDIISIAATGDGKTLTFWLPLLFNLNGILIVITALNQLGSQNERELRNLNISAIAIDADNATPETFKDIGQGKYRVVIVNPEVLMKETGHFLPLLRKKSFASRLLAIIVDEAHSISQWGAFREEYREIGRLRHIIPIRVPFYITSATLPTLVLKDVKKVLDFVPGSSRTFQRTNDRPNVCLVICKLQCALGGYEDLAFLVNGWKPGQAPPKKFLVFFDSTSEAEKATHYLNSLLPEGYKDKVKWFHSVMTPEFRENEAENLRAYISWGDFATDSFGMGLDLPDILLIVQWKAAKLNLVKLLRAEKEAAKAEKAMKAAATKKRKAEGQDGNKQGPKKRAAEAPAVDTTQRSGANTTQQDAHLHELPTKSLPTTHGVQSGRRGRAASLDSGLMETRRAIYERGDQTSTHWKSKNVEDNIDPALDDFINAGEHGFKCRRRVWMMYFGNDHVEAAGSLDTMCCKHLTSSCTVCAAAGNCSRCSPKPSLLCCDLCNPEDFPPSIIAAKVKVDPPRPRRSPIAIYRPSCNDLALKNTLLIWRHEKALEVLGKAFFTDYGPDLFMPMSVLMRLVDCGHARKIAVVQDIATETHWRHASVHADELVALVLLHHPVPNIIVEGALPLEDRPTQAANVAAPGPSTNAPTVRKPCQCSACHGYGHNRMNRKCPSWKPPNTASALASENLPRNASSEESPGVVPVHMPPPPAISTWKNAPSQPLVNYTAAPGVASQPSSSGQRADVLFETQHQYHPPPSNIPPSADWGWMGSLARATIST